MEFVKVIQMAWISENRALTQAEMENNADIIISYYRSLNYNDLTISAILGNMQAESSLSPIREEIGGRRLSADYTTCRALFREWSGMPG